MSITAERYQELVKVCNDARMLYIQGAETGISNELYDSYMADILKYEETHTPAADSPTRSVNPDMGDNDVRHPYKMLSLLDVFTPEDAGDFIKKRANMNYSVEYKLDGLSVQLIYEDGLPHLGQTSITLLASMGISLWMMPPGVMALRAF